MKMLKKFFFFSMPILISFLISKYLQHDAGTTWSVVALVFLSIIWVTGFDYKTKEKLAKGSVVWFTGLSGAGKTTLAKALADKLTARGLKVEFLDGDIIRQSFPNTGFSRADRDQHIRRVGFLASRLEKNGAVVIASLISPYADSRAFIRSLCLNYTEVYVSTTLAVCEKRDVKGLYAKARSGEIKQFTGIDDPYEKPEKPEITVDTNSVSMDEALKKILTHIGQ